MRLTFGPKNIIQIDDARIIYRNFSGAASKFNREGDRNFAVVIDDEEIKDALINDGWNVKVKAPRDDEETPFMYLPVKVKFSDYGPKVYLNAGGPKPVMLSEDTIDCLDNIDILNVNLDLRPFDWEVNGRTGRTAYLQVIDVEQRIDRFAARYNQDDNLPF